ncbi:hypothetical protein GSI_09938 [Ganoderma sinense ZZ0214-1]|uniref:Uncharacterized protein n=1 Tax=Ganoderma sinense ZZ0214-1 TaxID=1077348 RepID=A0A2G8S297_9APHY|nr:hypothetical protein GSI_09938 [Ganoderma sinense ZZ0214-1]
MPPLVRQHSSMSQIWAQLEHEIPDDVVASIPVEVFAPRDPGPDLAHAVDDTLAVIEEDLLFDALPTSTQQLTQPQATQSQEDTDIDEDVDMGDMGTPHTTVTSVLLNLNNRDVCLYEDWTCKPTAPSHDALRPPPLTLHEIIYDPPELDLRTWRALLLPRLAIPLKGKYHFSQTELNDRIQSQVKLGWKIFFVDWDVKQIYGDMCPSIGYPGEALSPLPIAIRSITESSYVGDPASIYETSTAWMLWGIEVKTIMVVGELTGIQMMRTGTLINIQIKDQTGICNVYYLISQAMQKEVHSDKVKQLTIGAYILVVGRLSAASEEQMHATTIITSICPQVVSENIYDLHYQISDHISRAISMYLIGRRVAVINGFYIALFKDLMLTQKEFSKVGDIAFEDPRVLVALPIIKRSMYRIQNQDPIAEVGVACLLKIALPRLARAHALVPEVIACIGSDVGWVAW